MDDVLLICEKLSALFLAYFVIKPWFVNINNHC